MCGRVKRSVRVSGLAAVVLAVALAVRPAGAAGPVAAAAPAAGDLGSNTVIRAEQLTFYYKSSTAVFERNVIVEDPQVRMLADKMTVVFDKQNNLKEVTATGNVKVWQADKAATGKFAVYRAEKGEIVLSGNATLSRNKDTMRGDKITFWVNEERLVCEPAWLVVYPSDEARKKAGAKILPGERKE